jgi:hypothetical protein
VPLLAWFLEEPRALWGLLLALPLVAAHLVRRRRLRVVVPFVPLLVEARGPVRGGGGWRRLSEAAALACRLLALAALALALARPLAAQPPVPVPLVLVLDLDVTVTAREPDGRSRLAHALALARAEVRGHAAGPVSVVLAGATPRVLAREAADREALAARGLEGIEAAPGTADLAAALDLARALAGERGRVKVLSARALPPTLARVDPLGTGTTDDDVGFVDLGVRAVEDGPRVRVEATIRGYRRTEPARPVRVRVRVGETVTEERALTLPLGADAAFAVELLPPAEGAAVVLTLESDEPDAFPANDRVSLWLPPPLRPSVLVVTGDDGMRPYTAALLVALGDRIDRGKSGTVSARALGGAWLFLAPLAGALPFAVGPPVERPLVWRTRAGHPLVRDLDLGEAWVARAFPLLEGPGVEGLAFAGADQPVVAEGEREGVRWVAVGLDPEKSDLPVRAVLPLLLKNALLRLARAPAAPLPPFVRAGGMLRPVAPLPGGPDARLRWPGGSATARLEPEGEGFRVPAGAHGAVEVETGSGAALWTGHTAFVDLDPARSIVPVRPPALPPAPREDPPNPGSGLLRLLLALAALLLLLDLLLSRPSHAPVRARG